MKSRREDFIVDEICDFPYVKERVPTQGDSAAPLNKPFAVYELQKSGIGTAEAGAIALKRWDLPRNAYFFAGRKDRHAITSQIVTIKDGPREDLEETKFSLQYLGRANRPIDGKDARGNRFQVVLRNLGPQQCSAIAQELSTSTPLIPNYFDDQRFGSVTASGEFPAVPWCLGDYEKAAYLALAEHNAHESSIDREQRAIVREHWGDWEQCKARLDRSNRRSVVTYLVDHPVGFKKAIALINREQRSLYVSALQSRLWNEVVSRWLPTLCDDPAGEDWREQESEAGRLRFPPSRLTAQFEEYRELRIPFPSARPTRWPAKAKAAQELLSVVCEEYGLTVHKLRFSHPRDVFFSRAQRPAFLQVDKLSFSEGQDELASDDTIKKLALQFQLGAGQYATMFLKHLQLVRPVE